MRWLGILILATVYQSSVALADSAYVPADLKGQTFIHDPSTIVKDGTNYFIFATGAGIRVKSSPDLIHWAQIDPVFHAPNTWARTYVPTFGGYYWAPDVVHMHGKFYLYYAVSAFGKQTSAIGLATNSTLDPASSDFRWTDCGPVITSTNHSAYNTIDPSAFLDRDGRLWLAFGSFWQGIFLTELDPATGKRIATNSPVYNLAWNHSIEAACLTRHDNYYYLFVNWGLCCKGTNSTYEVRVGRAEKVTGPYLDRDGKGLADDGGSMFLSSDGRFIGPGHIGIVDDGTTNSPTLFSYHYYDAATFGRSRLAVGQIDWSDGWPRPVHPTALNGVAAAPSPDSVTPYTGPVNKGVNTSTLTGKVMCGYQGWFGAPGDGSMDDYWRHWVKRPGDFADGNAKIDLWPDVSELGPSQHFPTGFKLPDGHPAEVFSSFQKATVLKHFEWMHDYGIDGVFVQRFAADLRTPGSREHCNTVLANCREGANTYGRTYAVMYDLSGLDAGEITNVMTDWRMLRRQMTIADDPAYLYHHGKPVVAVWGIGFNDHRQYTLAECRQLIDFLKNDGCTVMIGVPTHWRELNGDAVNDSALLDIAAIADIISPWTVGRYSDPAGATRHATSNLAPDLAWCRAHHVDYLPVVFPGFSWHNMNGGPLNQIPRQHGQFFWSQFENAKHAGAAMVYVAMFDEVDEGTAIFKCANDVPVGKESQFVTYEGLPSDFYLKMAGDGARLIRGNP